MCKVSIYEECVLHVTNGFSPRENNGQAYLIENEIENWTGIGELEKRKGSKILIRHNVNLKNKPKTKIPMK